MDLDTFEKLRFILNRKVDIALAPRESILEAINRHYGQTVGESADSMLQEFTDTAIDFTETERGRQRVGRSRRRNQCPDRAAGAVAHHRGRATAGLGHPRRALRGSDSRPLPDRRRAGRAGQPPAALLGAILSRIKILARIDIAERRRTQDGRIKVTLGEKELDLRVSVLPTNHGQSVVMRMLDKDSIKVGLRQLGLSDEDFRQFKNLIRRPNGIILVTGPTGSGKTTTLYAALNELNRPDRKIITAEDPVEYYLPGMNQVEVKHDIGLDFARIIRAMLRQAPNVILGGRNARSRDRPDGNSSFSNWTLGFQYTTYERCARAITRMIDMGVPGYLVASSVMAILAQRLVRVVCQNASSPTRPATPLWRRPASRRRWLASAIHEGKRLRQLSESGFRGRFGIFELMLMTSKIRELAFNGASTEDDSSGGHGRGHDDALPRRHRKALNGTTTIEGGLPRGQAERVGMNARFGGLHSSKQ